MKSNYQEQRENRINRYHELSSQSQQIAQTLSNRSSQMAAQIPFGQPILVGHHSEGRDRRFRSKIHNTMNNSVQALDKSEYYAEKAAAAEANHNISSDNPDAISLLEEKVTRLEELQERMKAANKLIKKGDRAGLLKLGYSEKQIEELFTPNCFGQIGYPSFTLSNNRQVITNAKNRLAILNQQTSEETTEKYFTDIGLTLIDNVEDNRLQLYFAEKPSEEIRKQLALNAFKWCKALECWQLFRSIRANYKAESIIKFLREQAQR